MKIEQNIISRDWTVLENRGTGKSGDTIHISPLKIGKSGDTIHISPLRLRGRGLRLGGWIEGRDHLVRRPAGCDERGKIGKSGDII